jgi:hypothetical protein
MLQANILTHTKQRVDLWFCMHYFHLYFTDIPDMNPINDCYFNYLVICLSAQYLYRTLLPNVYIMSLSKSTACRKNGENFFICYGSVMGQKSSDLHSWMVHPCDYILDCSKEDPNSVCAEHSRPSAATRRLSPQKLSFWITELFWVTTCFVNCTYTMTSSCILVIQFIFSALSTHF